MSTIPTGNGALGDLGRKREITLEQLLTMSSGLELISTWQMIESKDTVRYILDKKLLDEPGSKFLYSGGTAHLLSAILTKATGRSALAYAEEKLFRPLGIAGSAWMADKNGLNLGGTGLTLSPADMAKFGYLYLHQGVWNGAQIVPREWVEVSTRRHIATTGMNAAEDDGYGYLWWINSFGGFAAHGFGGQYIIVLPELDAVAVFTGLLEDPVFPRPHELTEKYVIPSCK